MASKFQCIYNCCDNENRPYYGHAICQDCLAELLENGQKNCPFCKQDIAPHDAQR